jgi:hypothetical protein
MTARGLIPIVFGVCGAAAALTGCSKNTAPVGTVGFDTLVFYALNHSGPQLPSGFDLTSQHAVTTDGSESFDVAFDLSPTGQTIIYPIKLVETGNGIGTPHQVGLKETTMLFDSLACVRAGLPNSCWLTEAPKNGYSFDTVFALTPGLPIIIAASTSGCASATNPVLYAKLVVDSVNIGEGQIFARATVDPNCGYRQFLPGIPNH